VWPSRVGTERMAPIVVALPHNSGFTEAHHKAMLSGEFTANQNIIACSSYASMHSFTPPDK